MIVLGANSSGIWFRTTHISSPTTWTFGSGSLKSTFYGHSLAIRTSGLGTSGRLEGLATYTASFGSHLHHPSMLLRLTPEPNLPSTGVSISPLGIRTSYGSLMREILHPWPV